MQLYHALQEILNKVSSNADTAKYSGSEKEMLISVLENQVRIGEAILILGGIMQAILKDDVTVEITASQDSVKH